jgi:uncharacterized protein YbjQ (UPF0145 family)
MWHSVKAHKRGFMVKVAQDIGANARIEMELKLTEEGAKG